MSDENRTRWYRRIGPGLITACVVIGPGSIMTSSKIGANDQITRATVDVCRIVLRDQRAVLVKRAVTGQNIVGASPMDECPDIGSRSAWIKVVQVVVKECECKVAVRVSLGTITDV